MPRIPYRFQKLIHNSKPSPVNGLFICHFHNSICHSHTSPRRVSKLRIRSHPKTNHHKPIVHPGVPKITAPKHQIYDHLFYCCCWTVCWLLKAKLTKFMTPASCLVNYEKYKPFKSIWPVTTATNQNQIPREPVRFYPNHRAMIDWPTTGWPPRQDIKFYFFVLLLPPHSWGHCLSSVQSRTQNRDSYRSLPVPLYL